MQVTSRATAASVVFGAAVVAYLILHFAEPELAITWSYAYLRRRPELWMVGAALVVLLPIVVPRLLVAPPLLVPSRPWSIWIVVATMGALGLVLPWVGSHWRLAFAGDDWRFYLRAVNDADQPIHRWLLTCWSVHAVVGMLLHLPGPEAALPAIAYYAFRVNQAVGLVTLAALAGAARVLSATRGEALVVTALAWTTFGVLQISAGYLDVYPVAAALLALYLWTGLRALKGEGSCVWPFVLAAIGPFFYEGLLLVGPSAVVLTLTLFRREGGRRLGPSLAVGVLAAGLATLPYYGAPFAWGRFVGDVMQQDGAIAFGYSPTSALIPWRYLATLTHAREILHTVLLIDGIGVLAILIMGSVFVGETIATADLTFLMAFVLPYFAYLVVMDPVMGAYLDWDLFSYGACATSLLGATVLTRYGRRSAIAAPLIGLALAANAVHVLARFHALEIDAARHVAESPRHVPG